MINYVGTDDRSEIRPFFRVIWTTRGAAAGAVLALLIHALPDQTKEIYLRFSRQELLDPAVFSQIVFALASLAALSFTILVLMKNKITRFYENHPSAGPQSNFLDVYVVAVSSLPIIGVIITTWRTLDDKTLALKAFADALEKVKDDSGNTALGADLHQLFPVYNPSDSPIKVPNIFHVQEAEPYIIVITILVIFILTGLLFRFFWKYREKLSVIFTYNRAVMLSIIIFLGLCVVFGLQGLNANNGQYFDFTSISRYVGAYFIFNAFLLCITVFLSALCLVYDKTGVPVLSFLFFLAIVWSYFNLNENHKIRTTAREIRPVAESVSFARDCETIPFWPAMQGEFDCWWAENSNSDTNSLRNAFARWWMSRPAPYKEIWRDRKYPIYIFAAQGGGIYAAHQAGLTLARLYDRCPALQHHVFAVSSVSGGSVGASVFAAALQERWGGQPATDAPPCTLALLAEDDTKPVPGEIEHLVHDWLRKDHLSPVLASGLFPDMFQRFFPLPPILGDLVDRARGLEAGFEETFREAAGNSMHQLRKPFRSHWSADGFMPMLVLNTTHVETGRQFAIAPVKIPSQPNFHEDILNAELDVPLSTAMTLSARFPFVTPAGTFKHSQLAPSNPESNGTGNGEYRHRFVDGGYFDNSGIETAQNIITELRDLVDDYRASIFISRGFKRSDMCSDRNTPQCPNIEFKLISFTTAKSDSRNIKVDEGVSELFSPLRAMYRTRDARQVITEKKVAAIRSLAGNQDFDFSRHALYPEYLDLPLGWSMSRTLSDTLSHLVGEPEFCFRDDDARDAIKAAINIEYRKQITKRTNLGRLPQGLASTDHFLDDLNEIHCNMCDILWKVGVDDRRYRETAIRLYKRVLNDDAELKRVIGVQRHCEGYYDKAREAILARLPVARAYSNEDIERRFGELVPVDVYNSYTDEQKEQYRIEYALELLVYTSLKDILRYPCIAASAGVPPAGPGANPSSTPDLCEPS